MVTSWDWNGNPPGKFMSGNEATALGLIGMAARTHVLTATTTATHHHPDYSTTAEYSRPLRFRQLNYWKLEPTQSDRTNIT
jgi:hypothetical protein